MVSNIMLVSLFIGACISNPTQGNSPSIETENKKGTNDTIHIEVKTDIVAKDEDNDVPDEGWDFENMTVVDTRRILFSKRVKPGNRPYMVYLSLTKESAKAHKYRGWVCGGVIVDASYVLTSAACVEDADRFYVVAGTTKFVDSFDYKSDDCVCKHRRRVVWKCIPKNYKFDFQDSIKWSSNDIAIVKVDKPFKLGVCEKGCEFAARAITYNNMSRELERAGTKGYIAGWGSGSNFREGVYRRQSSLKPENAKYLQEAKVCVMDKEACAKKWAQRFRSVIAEYMICTRDVMRRLSEICDKRYANCTDVEVRRYNDEEFPDSPSTSIDLGRHLRDPDDYTARRSSMQGGFCENDHGGPLIVKYKGKESVVGVISACKIDPKTHGCHGPFLYTSVYKNSQFLSCSIHKDVAGENCRRVFRSGITHEEVNVDWAGYQEDDDDKTNRKDEADSTSSDSSDDSDSGDENKKSDLKQKSKKESKKDSTSSSSEGDETKLKKERKSKKGGKKDKKRHSKKKGSRAKRDSYLFYESTKEDNVNEPDIDE